MKFFALDWERAFDFFEALGRASQATRLRITRAELKAVFEAKAFGEDSRALLAVGVLAGTLDSTHVRVAERFHDIHKLLRALARVPLAIEPSDEVLGRYVVEHFDEDERYSLGRTDHGYGYGAGVHGILVRLTSAAHTRALLETDDPESWEAELLERTAVLGRGGRPAARLTDEAGADLVLLLQHLIGGPGLVRARELPRLFPELTRARLALAVELGLRYCVLFAALDPAGEVQLFQWPRVHARLRQGTPPPPAPVTVSESFELAFALEDLQHLLVRAGDELRMKASGFELFAAAERELAAGLVALPDWLQDPRLDLGFSPPARVQSALRLALVSEHLAPRMEGRSRLLAVAEAGWAWLDLEPRARLAGLLATLRAGIATSGTDYGDGGPFRLSYRSAYLAGREDPERILRALKICFGKLPTGRAVLVKAFLTHHACGSNPLLAQARKHPERLSQYGEEELEERFLSDLYQVLFRALVPWGGARVGVTPQHELTFELTSVGRYLLGLASDFELDAAPPEARAPVRVQPDFEILFVAPSAMLEARIGRFAERRGKGVGVLFRITKESILAAARLGLGADEVLATLTDSSAGPVPKNVVHEIKAWFARCRHFQLESVQLLRCPDAETAERVFALGTKHLERLGDTLLALHDPAKKSELLRACAKQGLFLGKGRAKDTDRAAETS